MENKRYISKKEFWIFGIGGLGQGMIYAIMSSYISDFYLNILRVSPIFVLLLMLFARIWDAVNDPIMGMIVDRTNTKRGKIKPYLLITPIPVAILTLLLFTSPDLSNNAKMLYAAITYILWGMIYTMSDVPFWCLPNAMTPNPDERARVISFGRTLNGVGAAIPMGIFMLLGFILSQIGLSGLALEKTRYLSIALIAGVLGNMLFVSVYFGTRERLIPPVPKGKGNASKSLKAIFKCRPLMIIVILGVLASGRYLMQAGAIHVARYSFYVGAAMEGLSNIEREMAIQKSISLVNMTFAVCTALGMFSTMLLLPKLYKKYNYKQILITTCGIGALGGIIMFFIGYQNFWACVPFLVISSIPLGSLNVVCYAMIGDSLDYMEWQTGRRETGLGSAAQTFVNKLGNALATSFIVLMYIFTNLDVNNIGTNFTPNPSEISHTVRQGMFSMVSIIPALSLIATMIPLFFYDLVGKKRLQITTELAERRNLVEQNNNTIYKDI